MAQIAKPVVVEEEIRFSLAELSCACGATQTQITLLVEEGVLQPVGDGPERWFFHGASLRRARVALRLGRDLEMSPSGTAVVLELLDEIQDLRARLRRVGIR
jgi:chaperone modulatory protein CbpM